MPFQIFASKRFFFRCNPYQLCVQSFNFGMMLHAMDTLLGQGMNVWQEDCTSISFDTGQPQMTIGKL
ncbi:hypothetical protein CVS40_1640 [Lucilia cuprina]|nr:hypothetical protein CVS40_1640 [Lucilia cuprina]